MTVMDAIVFFNPLQAVKQFLRPIKIILLSIKKIYSIKIIIKAPVYGILNSFMQYQNNVFWFGFCLGNFFFFFFSR